MFSIRRKGLSAIVKTLQSIIGIIPRISEKARLYVRSFDYGSYSFRTFYVRLHCQREWIRFWSGVSADPPMRATTQPGLYPHGTSVSPQLFRGCGGGGPRRRLTFFWVAAKELNLTCHFMDI